MTTAEIYCAEYLVKIFYFALKKTGNPADAEELAADIGLSVLSSLSKTTHPANLDAWVWTVASNRWKRFAQGQYFSPDAHRADVDDYAETISDDSMTPEDAVIHAEELVLLRRELAFIRTDYRTILVAHYLEDKSVSMIAKEFSIPLGTVKTKLQNSRKKLKEGMQMAREFGKRSYNPEEVSFVKSGSEGRFGQPWTIVSHLLYKNIFLEVHDNPETAEELAMQIGLALPYMEDELAFLVREELLRKVGDKYETNFPIHSREEQERWARENAVVAKPLADKLGELIDYYMDIDGGRVDTSFVGYETAKWTLLMQAFDWFAWDHIDDYQGGPYPARPDGGAWVLEGYEVVDFDEPAFVGLHGYNSGNDRETYPNLHYGQFKFRYKNYCDRTPVAMELRDIHALWQIANGKTDIDAQSVEILLKTGYAKSVDGRVVPNVTLIHHAGAVPAKWKEDASVVAKIDAMQTEIRALFASAPRITRGHILEAALASGWLTDPDDLIPTAGAFIMLEEIPE